MHTGVAIQGARPSLPAAAAGHQAPQAGLQHTGQSDSSLPRSLGLSWFPQR